MRRHQCLDASTDLFSFCVDVSAQCGRTCFSGLHVSSVSRPSTVQRSLRNTPTPTMLHVGIRLKQNDLSIWVMCSDSVGLSHDHLPCFQRALVGLVCQCFSGSSSLGCLGFGLIMFCSQRVQTRTAMVYDISWLHLCRAFINYAKRCG